MFNDFKIELDPSPHGFYTFEDNVSGRIISEGCENIGWVYIFFHGWVNVTDIYTAPPQYGGGDGDNGAFNNARDPNAPKWGDKSTDKEILFQNHVMIYQGHQKLKKKQRYEWPFSFSFQQETSTAYNLPSSGHYTFINDRSWFSSVKYKVVAVHGEIGQRDDDVRWMFNPSNPRYLKDPPLKPTGIFLKIKEKLGGAAEQELKFVGIRPTAAIDPYMPPVRKWDLYVEGKYVPQLAPRYEDHEFKHNIFPFTVELQIPANVVIGQPFLVLLSVSSNSGIWNRNPPEVVLTSCKITAYIQDIVTIRERGDEKLRFRTIWDGKRLSIPLGSQPVDIGRIYSFSIAGEEIVQSFDTRTLHRSYNFHVDLTVEVGGKSFEARYPTNQVNVLSPIVAVGGNWQTQPAETFKPDFKQKLFGTFNNIPMPVRLHGSYVGRLTHDGAGLDRPLAEHSMMDAAIALSRTLTEAGVQHKFPGGTMIKLLPYDQSQMGCEKKSGSSLTDGESLRRLFEKSFRVMEAEESHPLSLHLGMTDPKLKENITIEFPDLVHSADELPEKYSEEKKGDSYSMNLTPVTLFNYRLWGLATHQSLSGEPEIRDIEPLVQAFKHELQVHRAEINTKFARFAIRTHPELEDLLARLGVDMNRSKGKEVVPMPGLEVEEYGEEQLPPYDPGWGRSHEQNIEGRMAEMHLEGGEPAPSYDVSPGEWGRHWNGSV